MHLFFDLDGTLTDSSPGIVTCINHGLAQLGRPQATAQRLRHMIGTPLGVIFHTLLESADPSVIDAAVIAYRAKFDEVGLLENSLFPGIGEVLQTLCDEGHDLQIVTAKAALTARRVIDHFDIARFFAALHGPGLGDRTCDKADLVGAALARVDGDRAHSAMIGDRVDDIMAARAHGVHAVAVTWGYGSREELAAAQPDYTAESVADLVHWVNARERV